MICYLEVYRAHVGTWAARLSWRALQGQVNSGGFRCYIGTMFLCAAVLASLLVIGGVEHNPGPGVEVGALCKFCVVDVTVI
jgi:hypothetical protein